MTPFALSLSRSAYSKDSQMTFTLSFRSDFRDYYPMPHAQVATAVGEAAFKDGMAQIEKPENLENYMADRMWCGAACINAHKS